MSAPGSESLSTPEELAAWRAGERAKAEQRLAELDATTRTSLQHLAVTLDRADKAASDEYAEHLGRLMAAAAMALEQFGLTSLHEFIHGMREIADP